MRAAAMCGLCLLLVGCGGAPETRGPADEDPRATLLLSIRGATGLVARVGLHRGETSLLTVPDHEADAEAVPISGTSAWRTRRQDFVSGPGEEAVYVEAESAFRVSPGPVRIVVSRGIFRAPVVRELVLEAGRRHVVDLSLSPPIDRTGTVCADLHLHVARFDATNDEALRALVAAEELELAALVDWAGRAGESRSPHWGGWAWRAEDLVEPEAPFFAAQAWGRPDRACALHVYGHRVPVEGESKHSVPAILEGAGDAFVSGALGRISVEGALLGRMHASEVLVLGQWKGLDDWYDALNVGARLAASAGTDAQLGSAPQLVVDYHSPIGANRVCVAAPSASLEDVFAAMKRGRGFVTNGPVLHLASGESHAGDVVALEEPREIRVDLGYDAPLPPGGTLRLLRNGRVVWEQEAAETSLRESIGLTMSESGWLALRLEGAIRVPGGDVPMAHTSPLWVEVAGRGVHVPESAARLAEAIPSDEEIRESGRSTEHERRVARAYAERARARLNRGRP